MTRDLDTEGAAPGQTSFDLGDVVTIGQATFRRTSRDKGWGGPWGQTWKPARWECIDCGRVRWGSDDAPRIDRDDRCARNGHAPCRLCGKPLARLNCGCPREHAHHLCPAKTAADRMEPQHADRGHHPRQENPA